MVPRPMVPWWMPPLFNPAATELARDTSITCNKIMIR